MEIVVWNASAYLSKLPDWEFTSMCCNLSWQYSDTFQTALECKACPYQAKTLAMHGMVGSLDAI